MAWGGNLHVVTAACSVACLEWYGWISVLQATGMGPCPVSLLIETLTAKEARKGNAVEENS